MSEPAAPSGPRRSLRLRVRIALLLVGLAVSGFCGIAVVGAWIVLQTEDAVVDAVIAEAARETLAQGAVPAAGWLRVFPDAAALHAATGLDRMPLAAGWHEVFAGEAGARAVLASDWSARRQIWTDGLEREYRLWVPDADSAFTGYLWADVSRLEFTETRAAALHWAVLAAAGGVALLAFIVSAIVVRWTVRPLGLLAERVRCAPPDRPADFAHGLADDEVGALARALDEGRTRALATLQREQRFLAECSHELRTPLATLRSALTLLPEVSADTAASERVIGRAARSVARMERLVQFFLVLAREGRQPAACWVELEPLAREVVEEHTALAAPPRPHCFVEMPACARVWAGREVVLTLVHNLVDNALKHSPHGRIRLSWFEPATLQIDDDGPGFADLSPQRAAPTQPAPGFGLGLELLRRLCRLHGWEIGCGVSVWGGARVRVTFQPRAPGAPATPEVSVNG